MLNPFWSGRGRKNAFGYLATRDKYYRKMGMRTLRYSGRHRRRAASISSAFGGWVS